MTSIDNPKWELDNARDLLNHVRRYLLNEIDTGRRIRSELSNGGKRYSKDLDEATQMIDSAERALMAFELGVHKLERLAEPLVDNKPRLSADGDDKPRDPT